MPSLRPTRWTSSVVALAAIGGLLLALDCATPTDLTVSVYSEVPCSKGASIALVGAASSGGLGSKAPSSASSHCGGDDGSEVSMGSVVLVPAGSRDESIVFAVMTRPDGQPPDGCLGPTEASGCIVAKRELRFEPHVEIAMRIDLRLSCLGVSCAADETCVKGACVGAAVNTSECTPSCTEGNLGGGDAGLVDSSSSDRALPPEVGKIEASGTLEVGAPDGSQASDGLSPTDVSSTGICAMASDCPKGEACAPEHLCSPVCNPGAICNGGCCTGSMCVPGTNASACGNNGAACVSCAGATPTCIGGMVCGQCGTQFDCPIGEACNGVACSIMCSPVSPCNGGCCNSGSCVPGTSDFSCGTGGASCTDCTASPTGHVCLANMTCGCNGNGDCSSAACVGSVCQGG